MEFNRDKASLQSKVIAGRSGRIDYQPFGGLCLYPLVYTKNSVPAL